MLCNHQFFENNEFTDASGNSYGLNWYDFEFRTYDPQLGRWWQADPLMQHASPYLAMSNNPVLFTDPLGLWDSDVYGNEDEPYTAWRGIDENGRLLIGGTAGKIGFTLNHTNFNGNYSSEQVSEQEFNQYTLNLQFIMGKTVSGLGFNQDVLGADVSFNFNESAQGGGGVDWSGIGNTLTAGGVAYYSLEKSINNSKYWVDAKGGIRSTELLKQGANGKYVRGVQGLRNSQAAAANAASKYAVAGKVVGGLGMGVTLIQYGTGQISGTEASIDLIMGGIGFTGWGAPISLMYFGGKFIYEYSTGNTLFEKPGGR